MLTGPQRSTAHAPGSGAERVRSSHRRRLPHRERCKTALARSFCQAALGGAGVSPCGASPRQARPDPAARRHLRRGPRRSRGNKPARTPREWRSPGTWLRRQRGSQTRGPVRAARRSPRRARPRQSCRRSSTWSFPPARRSSPRSPRGCAGQASASWRARSTRTPTQSRSSRRARLGSARRAHPRRSCPCPSSGTWWLPLAYLRTCVKQLDQRILSA